MLSTTRSITIYALLLATLAWSCGSDFEEITEGSVAVCAADLCAPQDETGIRFPTTTIGRSSNVQFQIRNTGNGPLVINNIEITNTSPHQFSQGFSHGGGQRLEANQVANPGRSIALSLRAGGEIQSTDF
jgi:hypothetical protein